MDHLQIKISKLQAYLVFMIQLYNTNTPQKTNVCTPYNSLVLDKVSTLAYTFLSLSHS